MSEISDLEGRLVAAMARIRGAVDARENSKASESDTLGAVEAKLSVLEAERDAALMAADTSKSALEVAESKLQTAQAELAELRDTVGKLQSVNAELRDAANDGSIDADAINSALAADLAALQSARAEELKQVEALLAQIMPSREGAPSA